MVRNREVGALTYLDEAVAYDEQRDTGGDPLGLHWDIKCGTGDLHGSDSVICATDDEAEDHCQAVSASIHVFGVIVARVILTVPGEPQHHGVPAS